MRKWDFIIDITEEDCENKPGVPEFLLSFSEIAPEFLSLFLIISATSIILNFHKLEKIKTTWKRISNDY